MYSSQEGTQPYIIQDGDSLWRIAHRNHTTIQSIMAVNSGIDVNNMYIGQSISIPLGDCSYRAPAQEMCISLTEQVLSNHIRMLWEQHVYWTRMVILGIAFDLPDLDLVTDRLLRNPKDFEEALRPFYGDVIAGRFADLFTNHLTIASELVKAAKAGDSGAADDAEKRWYDNANQIANFLGSINPYWSEQEWQKMLYDHLAMTKTEAVDILTGNYADSIDIFDNIEQQALEMADLMTQGIVRQFSQYF